jgi:prepilin-type N-terminal cleavage/methylation domain-containing protein
MFPQQASERLCVCGGACPEPVERVSRRPAQLRVVDLSSLSQRERANASHHAVALRKGWLCEGEPTINPQQSTLNSVRAGFTLLELLIVISIMAVLLVLIAPAFTTIKSGTDVTSAAYTVKGVLDTARTYAKANNTYTWVGFYEENVANPTSPNSSTPAVGRVIMSTAASKDGTTVYDPNNLAMIDATKLIQVGKLTKIDNVHLWTHTDAPSGTGETFDTRPNVASTYCIGDSTPANSATPFQYPVGNPAPSAQYTFVKAIQFSPRGDARINNTSNSPQPAAEIAFEPTHGVAVPASTPANVVAIQFGGLGGDVTIYRR